MYVDKSHTPEVLSVVWQTGAGKFQHHAVFLARNLRLHVEQVPELKTVVAKPGPRKGQYGGETGPPKWTPPDVLLDMQCMLLLI